MDITLVEMQSEVALIDMHQIQKALIGVQQNPLALVEFVKDPDGYMGKTISLKGMPSLHFHVKVEGLLYPKEASSDPINQIVFATVIEVSEEHKSQVLNLLQDAPPTQASPLDACETCTRCLISIVKWV